MANVKNGFSVSEILASKGQKLVVKNAEPLELELQQVQQPEQNKKFLPHVQLKAQFKELDRLAKEQVQKAILSGAELEYILNPHNAKEPIFIFQDGYLQFEAKEKKAA